MISSFCLSCLLAGAVEYGFSMDFQWILRDLHRFSNGFSFIFQDSSGQEEAEEPPEAVLRQARCVNVARTSCEVTEMVRALESSYITVDLAETSSGDRYKSFFHDFSEAPMTFDKKMI